MTEDALTIPAPGPAIPPPGPVLEDPEPETYAAGVGFGTGPEPRAVPVWPGCLTLDSAKLALGIDPADASDDAWLAGCVDAVVALVDRCRAAAGTTGDPPVPAIPDPSACNAGHLLTMRLYGRRNSAQGIATFAEIGAVYVSRYDPDIEQQLRIGAYLRPGTG